MCIVIFLCREVKSNGSTWNSQDLSAHALQVRKAAGTWCFACPAGAYVLCDTCDADARQCDYHLCGLFSLLKREVGPFTMTIRQEHDQRWIQNAQDIAAFLAGANPNWPAQDIADLLNLHLVLTKKEAVARLTEKWEEDIAAFDDIFTEIMTVSDILSEGIIKQFPDRF